MFFLPDQTYISLQGPLQVSGWYFYSLDTVLAAQCSCESLGCKLIFIVYESCIDKFDAVVCHFYLESGYAVKSNSKQLRVEGL